MEKTTYIKDITPGESFSACLFAIKDVKLLTDRSGKRRITLTAFDASGSMAAVRWDATEAEYTLLQSASLLTISGTIKEAYDTYPAQIRIERFIVHTELPEDLSPFLPPLPDDQAIVIQRFDSLLQSVANVHLSQLLARVFSSKRRPQFETAVAAKTLHHAYRGGLLRHTVEVGELCRAASKIYPALRHDLLITGALLHDAGKLFELEHGWKAGEYTTLGILEGHLVSGAFFIGAQIARIDGFPIALAHVLRHLILSHHDRVEWGAATTPALPEAVVLAKCDQLSAHTTLFLDAIENAAPGEKIVRRGDHQILVEDLGLDALDLNGFPEGSAPSETISGNLTLREMETQFAQLPLRGLVAAGDGERSSEVPVELGDSIAALLPPGGADYLIQVVGDSMIGAGIQEGDRAYVRHQETANSGDTVIAFVPGSGLVIKRFGITARGSFLFSDNPNKAAYPPIPINEGTRIQGVVTRIERDLMRY